MSEIKTHFGSGDFARVAANLDPHIPERLIHKQVAQGNSGSGSEFSAARKHPVHVVDLPSRVLSVTIGELLPGQSSRRHRHNYETILYVISGTGRTHIGDRIVEWTQGDAVYIPIWSWHSHSNESGHEKAVYLACENAPMLQNLGLALREEADSTDADHQGVATAELAESGGLA